MAIKSYREVLDFWFHPENKEKRFIRDDEFDEKIRDEFFDTWKAACKGLLVDWRDSVKERLAEIIVLDQFSRNIWRDDGRSYSQDSMALILAQEVVRFHDYNDLSDEEKRFILLPFMHSESLEIHDWASKYYKELDDEDLNHYEKLHREALEEFGRYPYRNEAMNRKSTPEEIKVLKEKGEDFYN